ncbi:ATP-binding protein [Corynebacterium confusum]|uniref:ATP-binding protein n=1 Tax=Corynebacterium confusum TaxID=71254 RepID=UPI0025B36CFF|nr:ATP-binding protein [Corynebacterium confusum]WJY89051.1 Nitrate/nitrite sensor protein NarX [Corynebacterium confusum]
MSTPPSEPAAYSQRRAAPYPAMVRPQQDKMVAGVASGVAENLGVDILWVRLALAGLALVSGVGLILYAGLWICTPAREDAQAPASQWEIPRWGWGLVVALALAAGVSIATVVLGVPPQVLMPLAFVAVGALLAWQAYDRSTNTLLGMGSLAAGFALVLAGTVVMAVFWDREHGFSSALVASLLTMLGLGVLVIPLVLKLWRSLAEEKAAKAAADERTAIASKLHDSVLQTLALIQKRADDGPEVARLARSQERQLRAWLFDADSATPETIFGAVEAACAEVEDLFNVRINPVTVGQDAPLSDNTKLAVEAAREALVNAGKHAQVETVDVFCEVRAGELTLFVRDRGVGFDPAAVAADRHGIRDSIRQRMERAGGAARLDSQPGGGTEVELTVAL